MREELAGYYRRLRRYGYNDSHSGNISARADDGFWITRTGACADFITPDDFVFCALAGAIPERASGDAALHRAVYRARADAAAVIHSHCPHAVALTMDGRDFEPPDFEGRLYFPVVPVISVPYEVYFDQAAERVAHALADHRVCIVRGHGVYAADRTLELAWKWTCSLEMSARTAWLARMAGRS
ncbi:MAG: class II aldolase/adducin family protein [Mariprofundaceae bacterium]